MDNRQRVRVLGAPAPQLQGGAGERSSPQPPSQPTASIQQAARQGYNSNSPTGLKQGYQSSPGTYGTSLEPVGSYRAASPTMQSAGGYTPEPPAPRSWTPSKLNAANSPARMNPAQALEQEMAELAYSDHGAATVTANYNGTPRSKQLGGASGRSESPAGFRKGYYNDAYEEAAAEAVQAGRSGSPAQPFTAQHNNLTGGDGSPFGSRPGSSASNSGGIGKLKERLAGTTAGNSSSNNTTVQAFREPVDNGVLATASSGNSSSLQGPVVAQRANKATRLVNGHASTSSRTTAEWQSQFTSTLASGNKLAALQLPGPSNGVIQCYVKRISGLLGMAPSFELRVEATDDLLAVARKRKKSANSSYLISMDGSSKGIKRGDEQLVGKLKANVLGTEYLLRGKGGDINVHKGFNAQLLAVNYKPTINHVNGGPRTMTALVPVPETLAWAGSTHTGSQFDELTACLEAARGRELPMSYERDLVMLHTIKPHFDPVKQTHYLDFKGRVTKASLKNLQLVHWDHNTNQLGTDLVLLFGKKGHDEYAMDFCYPLSTLQAFGLALSSIDSKMCYAI